MKRFGKFIAAFFLILTLLPYQQATASANEDRGHYTVKVETTLNVRDKPSPKAKVIGSLKNKTVVYVYSKEPGGWSRIKYNNKAGYVASSYLSKNGKKVEQEKAVAGHYKVKVATTLNVREKPGPKAKVIGSLKNDMVVYVYNTEPGGWSRINYQNKAGFVASSYLVPIKEKEEPGMIHIGMAKEEVLKRWGKPGRINRTITAYGISEQWIYPGLFYLYFEDGILTAIQD